MQEIDELLEKIEQRVKQKLEELKKDFEQKKVVLEQEFEKIIEQEKNLLKINFEKELEISKKRIYANNLIEYNKKIEEIKNKVISELLDTVKQKLLSLDKSLCYIFIKNIILHNLFLNEQNIVLFGKQNNIEDKEKNKLLAEISQEITKNYSSTKIEFSKENADFEFGVKIISGKKSKEFTLQTFIDLIKPMVEEEVSRLVDKEII
jgi:vacuolar-type H+-ATPase subunit E/Vma4